MSVFCLVPLIGDVVDGTGHRPHPENPRLLSDAYCKVCNGTTKKPLHVRHNLMEFVADMVESLDVMTIQAGGEAMRKLACAADF